MATTDVLGRMGGIFGFSNWELGLGKIGTFFVWFLLSLVVVAIVGTIYYFYTGKKIWNNKIWVFGMIGNNPMLKWTDAAKIINMGKAGERLFLLRKMKRLIPPPTIQSGRRLWLYWEREDHELINIGLQDVDEVMRKMNVKFIDTDMRMQRLGIEKNLQFRLQKDTWWDKYGERVIQFGFYAILMIMLIIIFTQFSKISAKMGTVLQGLDTCGSQVGVIPAAILPFITKYFTRKNG